MLNKIADKSGRIKRIGDLWALAQKLWLKPCLWSQFYPSAEVLVAQLKRSKLIDINN